MSDDSVTTPEEEMEMEFITKVGAVIDCVDALASLAEKAKDQLKELNSSEIKSMTEGEAKDIIKQIEVHHLEARLSLTAWKDTKAELEELFDAFEIARGKLPKLEEQESKGQGKPKAGHSGRKS